MDSDEDGKISANVDVSSANTNELNIKVENLTIKVNEDICNPSLQTNLPN